MKYDYANFITDCYDIVKQITDDDWKPDFVVGIVRGGLVPAVCISHRLNVPLLTIQWSTRDFSEREIPFGIKVKHESGHKKLLLVDDIVDNGTTMSEIKKILPTARIASLIYNTNQKLVVPEYYGRKIDRSIDKDWVNFWWEAA